MSLTRIKLQTTLTAGSYEEWAIARLLDRGWENHDLTRTIVREWLRLKHEDLEREDGINREAWERERGGNVRPLSPRAKGRKKEG